MYDFVWTEKYVQQKWMDFDPFTQTERNLRIESQWLRRNSKGLRLSSELYTHKPYQGIIELIIIIVFNNLLFCFCLG